MLNDFRSLLRARFFFSFATRMQAILIGWTMYHLTRDPLHLGLVGLAEAIPAIGVALVAGYVVDRSRPLLIYRWVVLGSLLSALVLLISQTLLLDPEHQVGALYLSSVISGLSRGFSQPSMFAITPQLVPRPELSWASAWSSSVNQTASVLGPPCGGLIYGFYGIQSAAGLACLLLVLATLCTFLVRKSIPAPQKKLGEKLSEELLSGARFVFSHGILLPAMTLDMLSVLFGGVTALLPIFADQVLHVGPVGLGALRAAPAVGAVLVSIALTRMDLRRRAGPALFASVFGFGLCILGFGLSTNLWLSLACLGLSGAFDGVSMVVRSVAVQLSSPEALRGRISAVNSIFIGSSNEIGEFESGVAAKLMGAVNATVLGGVICLVTVAVVYFAAPRLSRLDLEQLAAEAEA